MGGDRSNNIAVSPEMRSYFDQIQVEIDRCYEISEEARKKGFDPELKVEIPQALDLAARVEQLVGPKGIAEKIRNTTKKIGNRELVSLEIAKEIISGDTYNFSKTEDALDQAIRTGLAILTEGVLVAPLEGIAEVKLGKNKDGSNYVDLYFSGPIRSAGGTGQAMSVLIADVVRRKLGIDKYVPTKGEIERYKEEIPLYKRVQHLQYTPSADEIEKIVSGCPICINGEGTEDEEVTGYRDLNRVATNRLRGGACLVIAEGLCLKAPKILKHVKKLKLKDWDFLDIFVNKNAGNDKDLDTNGMPTIAPSSKYIGEVIAGRPVFSHPSRKGGFRLRYGRARTAGLASTAINPATKYLLDNFIAVGTQIKTERPGKGTIGTPCSNIEGPIVLLHSGDLVEITDYSQIDQCKIKKIIDLGEILIPFGEFIENNSLLPDAPYCFEWWIQDLQKSIGCLPEKYRIDEVTKADQKTIEKLNEKFGKNIDIYNPSSDDAFRISETLNIPLHPKYNLFWHDISNEDISILSQYIFENGRLDDNSKLMIPYEEKLKTIIIEIGALHKQEEGGIVFDRYTYPIIRCCGLDIKDNKIIKTTRYQNLSSIDKDGSSVSTVSKLAGITIRPRSPFRIGTRMGRPEKAAARKMRPPPHVLFPIGNYGGNQRLIGNASEAGKIEVEAGIRICPKCAKKTHRVFCYCGAHTEIFTDSKGNGRIDFQVINIEQELKIAQKNIGERNIPETIKGVVGTISKHKTPEPLEKGILRGKHDVSVFKDGTIRFDMTDAPLTHFRPREIGVSVKRLRELGYVKDYLGNQLRDENQLCELKVQDVIISKSCAEYFFKVTKFVDDLLVKFYKMDRFYNIRKLESLTGHLTIGLAPHTSAGSLSRIIGFTDAQVCFAHPFYHAAKRRNCDGDEDSLMLLMDALLNFSHSYVPDKRGGRMDLPLIITTRIDPSEVDKEAHNIDTLSRYPLAFYEATMLHKHSKDMEPLMDLVSSRLGTELQYEKFGFTHDTVDISEGPKMSNYKSLKTMMDKMNAQLNLAAKIRAVDEADVAYKVIERHFLPDIIGNLRAFSKQSFRCPICNITYRRVPLKGLCEKCNGKLILTVHEKSVKKYLEISKEIAEKYNISQYARQRIKLVEKSINSLFVSDKIRKTTLIDFL
jgi:DNA polymerase II large subunit